mgnify:CR=1 FL=1
MGEQMLLKLYVHPVISMHIYTLKIIEKTIMNQLRSLALFKTLP